MIQNTAFLQNCEILLSRNIHTSKSRSKRVAKMSRNKALESAVGGGAGVDRSLHKGTELFSENNQVSSSELFSFVYFQGEESEEDLDEGIVNLSVSLDLVFH